MPRGHSNISGGTERYPTNPDIALVPIEGGASVYTVRPLPPLAIGREEWEQIGLAMGWLETPKGRELSDGRLRYLCKDPKR